MDIQALLMQKEDNDSDEDMDISPRKPPAPTFSLSSASLQDKVQSVFEEALGVASIGEV